MRDAGTPPGANIDLSLTISVLQEDHALQEMNYSSQPRSPMQETFFMSSAQEPGQPHLLAALFCQWVPTHQRRSQACARPTSVSFRA